MSKQKDALINYRYMGEIYSIVIPGVSSWQEAEARLQALRATGRVEGWPCYRYSANPITLPFGALWARIKAWLHDLQARP